MATYSKKPLSIDEQIALLESRGLQIADHARARHYLSYISYYRLRAYTYPYQVNTDENHPFQTGTSFDQVLDDYLFDRYLRLLIFDAIERIEIAFRTQVIHHYSMRHGSHWYQEKKHYKKEAYFINDLKVIDNEVDRSVEVFIDHYRDKYDTPYRPPSWMTLEVISFGLLSKLYSNLKMSPEKKIIAGNFGLGHPKLLVSWMHAISNVRNICAHHARLWNRRLAVGPVIPNYTNRPFITDTDIDEHKLYLLLCCIAT